LNIKHTITADSGQFPGALIVWLLSLLAGIITKQATKALKNEVTQVDIITDMTLPYIEDH